MWLVWFVNETTAKKIVAAPIQCTGPIGRCLLCILVNMALALTCKPWKASCNVGLGISRWNNVHLHPAGRDPYAARPKSPCLTPELEGAQPRRRIVLQIHCAPDCSADHCALSTWLIGRSIMQPSLDWLADRLCNQHTTAWQIHCAVSTWLIGRSIVYSSPV